MSKFNGVKTNNAKVTAKEEIRNKAFNSLNEGHKCLEVFSGAGEMYEKVWHKCIKYKGIDIKKYFDKRDTICGDAEKIISTLDVSEYNIFDIDSYGSPYTILDIITKNTITSNKIAFIITDGCAMDLRMGRVCKGLRELTGITRHKIKKAHKIHDDLIAIVISEVAKRLSGNVEIIRIAKGVTGSAMRYYMFVVSKSAV
jgi:hypothetical protein